MKDLVCAVPDKNMEAALSALLERPQAIGICPLTFDIWVHPRRDPGLFREGVEFLRSVQADYQHGLLLLDATWDGAPNDLQAQLDNAIRQAGLQNWARAIVIEPELEAWVWSDSPHVEEILGWCGRKPTLREWLDQQGLWTGSRPKPQDPKRAVEAALYAVSKPRSSAIYRRLASRVSLQRCHDPAFRRLHQTLRQWFGV